MKAGRELDARMKYTGHILRLCETVAGYLDNTNKKERKVILDWISDRYMADRLDS